MKPPSLRLIPVLLSLLLCACGAQPAPEFLGAKRRSLQAEGRDYVLFTRKNRAEIIRLSYARPGEHDGIRSTMMRLMEETTGCRIITATLQGDSGEMRASLDCPE